MVSSGRRKVYSTAFRSDWVLRGDGSECADLQQTPSDNPLNDAVKFTTGERTSCDRSSSNARSVESMTARSSAEERKTVPVSKLSNGQRLHPKPRYSRYHTDKWVVSSAENAPTTATLILPTVNRAKSLRPHSPNGHSLHSEICRGASATNSLQKLSPPPNSGPRVPQTPTRKWSSYSSLGDSALRPPDPSDGHDAPPKPPFLSPSY